MNVRAHLFPLMAAAVVLAAAHAGAESPGRNGGFAVVELFTSEGCSSCPRADEVAAKVSAAAAQENLPVYVLEWHVDYWDYLGWKDPYDSRAATERQYSYARALPSQVYTPQMVINGSIVPQYAGDLREVDRLARSTVKVSSAGSLRLEARPMESPTAVEVHAEVGGAPPGTRLLLALVEDGLGTTPTAGENRGRRLAHSNVVRSFTVVAAATGDARVEVPPGVQASRSRLVGIIEDARTMRILAADQVSLAALASASLSGRVIDARGMAVSGAMVQACSTAACVPAMTDGTGAFVFNGLTPGRYSIAVESGPAQADVTLEYGRPLVLSRPIIVTR